MKHLTTLIALALASPAMAQTSPENWMTVPNNTYVAGAFPSSLTFTDGSRAIVTIHRDGRVEYPGTADEAAKAFWKAVSRAGWCGAGNAKDKP